MVNFLMSLQIAGAWFKVQALPCTRAACINSSRQPSTLCLKSSLGFPRLQSGFRARCNVDSQMHRLGNTIKRKLSVILSFTCTETKTFYLLWDPAYSSYLNLMMSDFPDKVKRIESHLEIDPLASALVFIPTTSVFPDWKDGQVTPPPYLKNKVVICYDPKFEDLYRMRVHEDVNEDETSCPCVISVILVDHFLRQKNGQTLVLPLSGIDFFFIV